MHLLHELKNRAAYASVRSLRSVFTDYKYTRESWKVGDDKRYAGLSAIAYVSDYKEKIN